MKGKLTLVGAGPGDPELISIKGMKAIKNADVILYDALAHPDLLEYARPGAEKIYVGKRAGKHAFNQEEINELIVAYALRGNHVVRLKGGDPFVFAHGKEELEYAETFGIECTSVLGISSVNLPGLYGIPLTRRDVNESFWVVTATTKNGTLSKDVFLAAQSNATAVFLMGLNKLEQITAVYKKLGRGNLPAALISKGSLEDGNVIFGTAATLLAKQRLHRLPTPALVVVGEAVGTHEYFYEKVKALEPFNNNAKY
ncbi:uroporphyrinogen-III C-methyltransferase [Fulvivirgaceae bacterium BMA12]|uniref:uroporphyrinogen-III C-methyltransferase n=1 Tax=Agaribacillus aureus TaxID=3051825 RepID=A0ABT8L543_9BACT|nr:uroporphyrinogen-III C-methyltransferase [Fulvivirgaceae bacterium BMA12]